jgi:hypothetical protein
MIPRRDVVWLDLEDAFHRESKETGVFALLPIPCSARAASTMSWRSSRRKIC